MFTFIKNIFWVITKKPGSHWLLGNITPGQALAALALPFLAGAILAGLGVWYISRRRRAAAILDTIANNLYSKYLLELSDGALYVDGVKGRYVSVDSTKPGPFVDLPYTVKEARKALDRAGLECLD